jgi:hypothetical protein
MSEQTDITAPLPSIAVPTPTRAVCKFAVRSVKDYGGDNKEIDLVTRYDPALPEDQKFSKFTPSGEMKFTLQNPALNDFFQPGQTYLITIESAPETAA